MTLTKPKLSLQGKPIQDFHFYGRRLGRPLRNLKRELVSDLLPQLHIHMDMPDSFHPKDFFEKPYPSYALEIGFGGGENLCHQAQENPEIGFIGLDPFMNGVASLLQHIHENNISNIRLAPLDARPFLNKLENNSLNRIFVLFLDPWPKKRHHKRRLVTSSFIEQCAQKLTPDGELILATDHKDYENWMREAIANQKSLQLAKEFNTEESRPDFIPRTRYESKALEQNRFATYFSLKFS